MSTVKVTDGGRSVKLTRAEFDYIRRWAVGLAYNSHASVHAGKIAAKFAAPEVTKAEAKKAKERDAKRLERNVDGLQMRDHVVERTGRQRTKIQRARCRSPRLDAGFEARRMDVELLIAERERNASGAVVFEFHAEHIDVERKTLVQIARRQNDVVDAFDHDRESLSRVKS